MTPWRGAKEAHTVAENKRPNRVRSRAPNSISVCDALPLCSRFFKLTVTLKHISAMEVDPGFDRGWPLPPSFRCFRTFCLPTLLELIFLKCKKESRI